MPKMKFSELDSTKKRAVSWLADEAETLTPNITAAASHVGEIWEDAAFMKESPRGLPSTPHWPNGCGFAIRTPNASWLAGLLRRRKIWLERLLQFR